LTNLIFYDFFLTPGFIKEALRKHLTIGPSFTRSMRWFAFFKEKTDLERSIQQVSQPANL
jgi:hypothetical protein